MPAVGTVLSSLIKAKADAKFKDLGDYAGPLAQQNPMYFHHFCEAIGKGIADGTPMVVFQTEDNGLRGTPAVVGAGSGVGIMVDQDWFTENLYKNIRNIIIANYGSSNHPEWNVERNFLTALSEAISESVTEHYATAWVLVSSHLTIYSGTGLIKNGGFSGIVPMAVKASMIGHGNLLQGTAWPLMCEAIAETYASAIHTKSTGTVTIAGTCSSGPNQVCGLPSSGAGSGTAT